MVDWGFLAYPAMVRMIQHTRLFLNAQYRGGVRYTYHLAFGDGAACCLRLLCRTCPCTRPLISFIDITTCLQYCGMTLALRAGCTGANSRSKVHFCNMCDVHVFLMYHTQAISIGRLFRPDFEPQSARLRVQHFILDRVTGHNDGMASLAQLVRA